jgi:hypothetical protein
MPYRRLKPSETRFKGTQVHFRPKRQQPSKTTSPAPAKPKAKKGLAKRKPLTDHAIAVLTLTKGVIATEVCSPVARVTG